MKRTLTILFTIFSFAQLQAAIKPNLVFIIADDCTFRDIGCYGGQARTPNIDRLAKQGMRFTRCFQAAPMCSPTRHNIYTGLYPVKSGAWPNHTRAYPHIRSIVHHLRPLGYRVTQTGKTHINPPDVFPFENFGGGKNPDMKYIDRLFSETAKGGKPFALDRVTWTGKVPFEIHEMRAKPDGFELTFTHEIDAITAANLASYSMSAYTYIYRADYGSPVVDQTTPKIVGAEVKGPKTVRLTVDKLIQGHVHELRAKGVRSAKGLPILHPVGYYTLNEIPPGDLN